jgi:hypothetical protein
MYLIFTFAFFIICFYLPDYEIFYDEYAAVDGHHRKRPGLFKTCR